MDDCSVWTWGDNETGQLGDGTFTNHGTPVQVQNLSGVQAIAGGGSHSLA
jgi:alpha-tubulin suppressor-like RCC1 family protein